MTLEQKTFNFTGVSVESNKRLINNLEFSIAQITPNGYYHLNIPEQLVEDIAALKARLDLYQGFSDYQKEVGTYPAKDICELPEFDHTEEEIEDMDYHKLEDITNSFIDALESKIGVEDRVYLNILFDQLDAKFLNERYEKERLNNLLYAFLGEHKLYSIFEMMIEKLKKEQLDEKDEHGVIDELYGNLDEFMKDNPSFKADWGKNNEQNTSI